MRVEEHLRQTARRLPNKVAVVAGDRRATYAELDEASDRLAAGLRRHGVGRGDRVAIFLENSYETILAVYGVWKAGGVFSVVNHSTKAEKLAFVLRNARARAVITGGRLVGVAAAAVADAPTVSLSVVVDEADLDREGGETLRGAVALGDLLEAGRAGTHATAAPAGIDMDLAMIAYTSGSTGAPKGVMMTHRNLEAAVASVCEYLGNTQEDVILAVLPLSFGYGLNQVLTSCRVGATLILEKSFAFPILTFQKLRQERVTGFALVPTIAAVLLNLKQFTPGALPDLRYVTNAAAALPPAHLLRLQDLLPAARIYSMYGQTECTRACYLPPELVRSKPGSVGVAIPNTECTVVDEHGRPMPAGEVGELVVRGPHVMQGYWEDPEATARALRPGPVPGERVLYTNDLFKADEDGHLYFVARRDDIIKTRGEKVSPKDVENAIYAMPGVAEVAVVGVPDPILGQAIKACVVPAEGVTLAERDVIRQCAQHLEDFMVPKTVEFRTELPKTTSGKIRRAEVQAEASGAGTLAS